MLSPTRITVETVVRAPAATAWRCWVTPECIMQWNAASPDWHCPRATMDLRVGGTFTSRMEAKDGTMGFDFEGKLTTVEPNELLAYAIADGRTVTVTFIEEHGTTRIVEAFDAEQVNPVEMQRAGWQAILDNFKHHAEAHAGQER